MTPFTATCRLQLHKGFTFHDAAAAVPYLARLGISHLYCSPILRARPGSMHGYDIVDHAHLNPELGGEEGFAALMRALDENDMGCIVDIVPNHMGVGSDNPRWLDVLAWGPAAASAVWFDINWRADAPGLKGKILAPVLGDQYGRELERGHLRLKFDAAAGSFAVWAYDHAKLPIHPPHYADILAGTDLEALGAAFADARDAAAAAPLQARLAQAPAEDVARAVAGFAGKEGDLASWGKLAALIARQYWRAAYFKAAADDINYRRFFNINDLAGLRAEVPEVFAATHARIFKALDQGPIEGLRIDHVDGLYNPRAYLGQVRAKLGHDRLLLVEKILAGHEALRDDWPVDGTTGYDFANLVFGLMRDPAGADPLRAAYRAFTGDPQPFSETARIAKHVIMDNELASELHTLAGAITLVAARDPHTVDFTHHLLHRALKEVVACFPVYRAYLEAGRPAAEADRRDVSWAIAQARKREAGLDPAVFDFLQSLMLGEAGATDGDRAAALHCALRLQQYTGPVMAKALEDTAFYRHPAYLTLNEVGGNPEQFHTTVAGFHRANQGRAEKYPRAMLTTATHDSKRGADVHARLAVLSERAEDWTRQVASWSRVLRARRGDVEGNGPPDRRDEYALYQTLAGSWPPEMLDDPQGPALAAYKARITGAMIKAVREAKVNSTWAAPDAAYEEALTAFIGDALDPAKGDGFLAPFLAFTREIAAAGARNTLAQTVLALTVPGVPDIYQGRELWDLALVDPDNRRPVDFARHAEMLVALDALDAPPAKLLPCWRDGRFKLAAAAALLRHRRAHPALFEDGGYAELAVEGDDAARVCAFLRGTDRSWMVVIVIRFPARGPCAAAVRMPEALHGVRARNIIGGDVLAVDPVMTLANADEAGCVVLVPVAGGRTVL